MFAQPCLTSFGHLMFTRSKRLCLAPAQCRASTAVLPDMLLGIKVITLCFTIYFFNVLLMAPYKIILHPIHSNVIEKFQSINVLLLEGTVAGCLSYTAHPKGHENLLKIWKI